MLQESQIFKLIAEISTGELSFISLEAHSLQDILKLADEQDILSMMDWQMKKQNFILPHELRDKVKTKVYAAQVWQMLLNQTQHDVQTALSQSGIDCIWLKGSALSLTIYQEPYLRGMSDLDLLVASEHIDKAVNVLKTLGYIEPDVFVSEVARKKTHHYHFLGGPNNKVSVELHFGLLGAERERLLSTHHLQWFLNKTKTIPRLNKWTFNTLTPEAHLLYLCAHALIQHGEHELILRHLLDVHLLISKYTLDWHLVTEKAIQLRWAYAVHRMLTLTGIYFGTTIPEAVLDNLQSRQREDDLVYEVQRFQSHDQTTDFLKLQSVFRTLTYQEKLLLVKDLILPSKDFMRKRYQVPQNKVVWHYYLYRWWKQTQKIFDLLVYRANLWGRNSSKQPKNK